MSARWLRRILALAPRDFRARYMEELVQTYEARRTGAARGVWSAAWVAREMIGAWWLVLRLRFGGSDPYAGPNPRPGLGSTWQDIRFAARTLRRHPGFALAAILILAVGIGANTAIFSAANAFFFQPLPFARPDRLVTVYETNPDFGWVTETAAPANLFDWRESVEAFADVSGYSEFTDNLTAFRDGEPMIVTGTEVMGNFFTTLGTRAELGRTFTLDETWVGNDDVVVISHDLWVRHYGADPNVVGRRFEFATHSPVVIGVMPEGFSFPDPDIEIWYPIGWDRAATQESWFRRAHFIRAFARLNDGVSLEEADAQLQVVVERLQEEYPSTNTRMGAGIMPMRDFLVRDVRTPLLVLVGAVCLLLLLACTNVANLMLVRAAERSREVALRRALGAGRARIIRQMLTESLLLATVGGVGGLALGWAAVRVAAARVPLGIGGATSLSLDHRVVLFTCAATALSAVLFGVAPALRASAAGETGEAAHHARGGGSSATGLRTVGLLVAVEVALALLLVAGAGLMTRTFIHLGQVDPGFRSEGVLAVQFALQSEDYPSRDQVLDFYDRFERTLEARPGIERVGQVARLPLDGPNWSSQFQVEGWPADRVGQDVLHRSADVGYFDALQIPLLAGRMFEPSDLPDSEPVVLINQTLARQYFGDDDPIGQRIAFERVAGPESTWYRIIGVVGDQHQESLATPTRPEVFESGDQDWDRLNWTVLRVDGEPGSYVETVQSVLAEMDPRIPLAAVRTLED
ncbi:MAG: ADOP family duplicated permease, partial [Gemmatimonadota bacterium]